MMIDLKWINNHENINLIKEFEDLYHYLVDDKENYLKRI
jgi:hypothetical protein